MPAGKVINQTEVEIDANMIFFLLSCLCSCVKETKYCAFPVLVTPPPTDVVLLAMVEPLQGPEQDFWQHSRKFLRYLANIFVKQLWLLAFILFSK